MILRPHTMVCLGKQSYLNRPKYSESLLGDGGEAEETVRAESQSFSFHHMLKSLIKGDKTNDFFKHSRPLLGGRHLLTNAKRGPSSSEVL